ncbi:Serine/threonine-protein kinase [Arachis hypogaea]|nr:Serine/threonine-protein kinase [Arachis hypogaea]
MEMKGAKPRRRRYPLSDRTNSSSSNNFNKSVTKCNSLLLLLPPQPTPPVEHMKGGITITYAVERMKEDCRPSNSSESVDVGLVMRQSSHLSEVVIMLVINHQPYDQKADVFSFSIILWELVTAKVPYDTMTPLQAAFGVRQGLCPELPKHGHPKLLYLRQRCWEADPSNRPSFQEITIELENLLQQVDNDSQANGA